MNQQNIEKIIENHNGELGSLISILEDIQDTYHYLPEDALRIVSNGTGKSLVDIYGVATFYKAFSLKPRGKHLISVCMGTACHVRSAPGIADEFTHQLGLRPGETTADREFTLETVNCLGTCALGPIVVVDGHYFTNVKRPDVKKIIEKARSGFKEDLAGMAEQVFPVEVYCPHCNHTLMDAENSIDDYPSIALTGSFNGTRGWIRMSGLYGNHTIQAEHPVPSGTQVNLFCPNCQTQLEGTSHCLECDFPMVSLRFNGGGSLLVCSCWGCANNTIYLNGFGTHKASDDKNTINLPG